MTIFEGIILGLIQGLTEFIPISSSGHLILVRDFFHVSGDHALAVDAVLQLATSFSVLIYFIPEFRKFCCRLPDGTFMLEQKRFLLYGVIIAVGTIPAVIAGMLFEDQLETVFRSAELVATGLLSGSVIMWFAERLGKANKTVTIGRSFIVGLFQMLALVPGMSRSGMTISGGLFSGFTRKEAARFSFLLSLPLLIGSGLKKLIELGMGGVLETLGVPILAGSIVAFSSGLISIHFLLKYLKTRSLHVFIYYRVILAIIILVLARLA